MPSDQCPVIQGGHWGSYPGGNWGSYPGWALGILSRVGTGDPIQGGHWGSYPGWALGILGRKKMVGDCSNQMLLRARRRHRARANSLLRGPAGVLWPPPLVAWNLILFTQRSPSGPLPPFPVVSQSRVLLRSVPVLGALSIAK
eukprot:gene20351-biopygen22109